MISRFIYPFCIFFFIFSCEHLSHAYLPGIGTAPAPVDWKNYQAPQPSLKQPITVSPKGAASYSYPIKLPPSLASPSLSLNYNSFSKWDKEMPFGWSIGGILQITRPTAPIFQTTHSTGHPGYNERLLLTGPLEGNLAYDDHCGATKDLCYNTYTASSGDIYVRYNESDNEFLIYDSGGNTWELSAKDHGDGTDDGTALWRVDRFEDPNGNEIVYNYNTSHHIESVEFGGTAGAPHHIHVSFQYTTRNHHWYNLAVGFFEEEEEVLEKILVYSNGGLVRAYELTTTIATDGGDHFLLSSIQEFGDDYDVASGTGTSEPAANFEYSEYNEHLSSVDPAVGGNNDFGRVVSISCPFYSDGTSPCTSSSATSEDANVDFIYSWSKQESMMIDMNRDGWPDYVESDGSTWTVQYQERGTSSSFPRKIGPAVTIPAPDLYISQWNSKVGGSSYNGQDVMLIDMNGDGYPDLVSNLEEGYEEYGTRSDFNKSSKWGVYYGLDTGGFESSVTWEQASSKYIEWLNPRGGPGNESQLWQTLMDVNGDGRPDIVRAVPGTTSAFVRFKDARGEGWKSREIVSAPWLTDLNNSNPSGNLEGLKQVDQTLAAAGETLYVNYTYQWGGFVDLNGDGYQDYVITDWSRVDSPTRHWSVYFGNGHGWEEKTLWPCHQSTFMFVTYHGDGSALTPQTDYVRLVDVNGDGLLDLVDFENRDWYENRGDEFATSPNSIPSWWPNQHSLSDIELRAASSGPSVAYVHQTSSLIMDFNLDGMMDHINSYGYPSLTMAVYGANLVPNLLIEVKQNGGLETSIDYTASSNMEPAGDPSKEQNLWTLYHLVSEVTTEDSITGESGTTAYTYENGYFEKGFFYGFESRETMLKRNSTWMSRITTEYELNLYYGPLLTHREVYTDRCYGFAPSMSTGCSSSSTLTVRRSTEDITYKYFGFHYLPQLLQKTLSGENATTASNTTIVEMDYTRNGFHKTIEVDGDGDGFNRDQNDKKMKYSYSTGGNEDVSTRLNSATTYGWDPLNGTWRTVGVTNLYYDNNESHLDSIDQGNLTAEVVYAGWHDGGETVKGDSISWSFEPGPRGELLSIINNDTGQVTKYTYDFGDAVKKTETNALNHKLIKTIDNQGRVTDVKDPNGVIQTSLYDALGYVTEERVKNTKGVTYTTAWYSYQKTSTPFSKLTVLYDESRTYVNMKYEYYDGSGNIIQTRGLDALGLWVVTDKYYDLNGNLTQTSRPRVYGSSRGVEVQTQTYYDAFGNVRENYADVTEGLDPSFFYIPLARQTRSVDSDGYENILDYDAYGRIIRVEQGRYGDTNETAKKYEYDVFDKLVKYTDANGNVYTYSYDAAGRLRETNGPDIGQRTFTYELFNMVRMEDSGGGWVETDYDELNRVELVSMSDPLSHSGQSDYTFSYDTKWLGARDEVTDPLGETSYEYDELGRATHVKRSFWDISGAVVHNPEVIQSYNLLGKLTDKQMPSGKQFEYTYNYNWLTGISEVGTGLNIALDYNSFGLMNSWSVTLPGATTPSHIYSTTYSTPLRRSGDSLTLPVSRSSISHTYSWQDNGLLSSKQRVFTGTGISVLKSYDYDILKRLEQVTSSAGAGSNESFTYSDRAGNIDTLFDPSTSTTWSYGSLTNGHWLSDRSDGLTTETFEYDPAGRLSKVTDSTGTETEYMYLGNGLLKGVKVNKVIQLALDYDMDGKIVRRSFGNPDDSATQRLYQFQGWKVDERTAEQTEYFGAEGQTFGVYVNGDRRWFYTDNSGHVDSTFNDAGAILSSREHSAYGQVLSSTATDDDLSFHGSTYESNHGLYAMGVRHMNAKLGTFLQPEPLLLSSLNQKQLADPTALHPYRYSKNNPASFRDPTGFSPNQGEGLVDLSTPENSGLLARFRALDCYIDEGNQAEWRGALAEYSGLLDAKIRKLNISGELKSKFLQANAAYRNALLDSKVSFVENSSSGMVMWGNSKDGTIQMGVDPDYVLNSFEEGESSSLLLESFLIHEGVHAKDFFTRDIEDNWDVNTEIRAYGFEYDYFETVYAWQGYGISGFGKMSYVKESLKSSVYDGDFSDTGTTFYNEDYIWSQF